MRRQIALSFCSWRFLVVLSLMLGSPTALGNVYAVVNELRSGGCALGSKLSALQTDARLQDAVKRIANGASAEQAARAMNYPATQLSTIRLRGYSRDPDIRRLLAQKYCKLLLNPVWQHMANEQRGDELWIVLAAPQAIPTDANAVAQRVLTLVNQARANGHRCGQEYYAATGPLRLNATLTQAAQLHAVDMSRHKLMQHSGSDGSTPAQRVTRQGYRWQRVAENVAAGATNAEQVVLGWLDSPGHCANIMNPTFSEMGIAFAVNTHDDYVVYWAQSFAMPR